MGLSLSPFQDQKLSYKYSPYSPPRLTSRKETVVVYIGDLCEKLETVFENKTYYQQFLKQFEFEHLPNEGSP